MTSCDKAIALEPDYALAYYNRGWASFLQKRFEEALQSYAQAIRIKPNSYFSMGTFLLTKMKICDWSNYSSSTVELYDRISNEESVGLPFLLLAISSSLDLQKKASEIWMRRKCPKSGELEELSKLPAHEKIRIGYFSADFRNHATAFLMAELLERHDRSKFEVIAFSFGPDTDDAMRERLHSAFNRFIDVSNMSDREVALLARNLEIDIGVDLMGFTEHARTNIFAMRAAPIQVNYLGYPGTTGTNYIDYLIADPTVLPASSQPHYTEKIVYLPNSYQPNDRRRQISGKVFTRSELGLPQECFVYCCFNNNYKITPNFFESWMRIYTRRGERLVALGGQ